jgi:hypothetical protein
MQVVDHEWQAKRLSLRRHGHKMSAAQTAHRGRQKNYRRENCVLPALMLEHFQAREQAERQT